MASLAPAEAAIDALPEAGTGAAPVPLVDLTGPRDSVVEAVAEACRDWGMFQIAGHGIGENALASFLAEMQRFFARPSAEKLALSRSLDNPWGYYDRELTKTIRDRKEIFDIGPECRDEGEPFGGQTPWPQGDASFTDCMTGWMNGCDALSAQLLRLIFAGLGEGEDIAVRAFNPASTSFLRLNRFPAGQTGSGRGIHHHSDAGALTVLLADNVPGLQVLHRGQWHLVRPEPGALVINIGDMVEVWSNGLYPAPLHRVLAMDRCDRYSAPFFYNPSYAATIAPLPTVSAQTGGARFKPISWGDFRRRRAEGDFGNYGTEVQIADYAI
ncbi:MAG: isopenicillin N synthase family dioxygenase [Novosphingobium sp.]